MKRLLLITLLMAAVIFSCGKFFEEKAYNEIRQMEYTRNSDPDKFITFLNDKNPSIRKRAVEALGRIQDSTQVVLMSNRLNDENPQVRMAAAFALGQLFSTKAEPFLIEAVKMDRSENVRAKIAEALGKCSSDKSFNILKDFLESSKYSYEKVGTIACGILAYRGFPPYTNVFPLQVLLNQSKQSDIRWRAAYGLYRIASPASFKDIYPQISNPEDPLIRFYSLKALTSILPIMKSDQFKEYRRHPSMIGGVQLSTSPEFFDTVAKLLLDGEWFVRVADLQLIGTMKNRFFRDEIIQATRDPHPYVQMEAIRTLTNFNSRTTRRELRKIYSTHSDWRMRGEALLALSELSPREALKIVESDLMDVAWPQNYFAIKALGKIKEGKEREKSTDLLMQLVETENKAQMVAALEALIDRAKIPADFLIGWLQTKDPAVTTIVATHMAFRKETKAVEPLMEAYESFTAPRDIEAMQAIITALDSIKSPLSIAFLQKQLKNPYPPIRKQALGALKRAGETPNIKAAEIRDAYLTKWDFEPVDTTQKPQVKIETLQGEITIELYPDKAPVTVANFLSLVRSGFYEGIYFHRVVPGFVIQAGDPRGDGWGGPGYSIPCEYNDIFFDRGVVGIAHAGKDTGGSQFFITHTPQPHLNGRYTAFGKVIKGMETADRIMIFDKIEKITLLNAGNNYKI